MDERVDIEGYLKEFRSSVKRLEGQVANLTEDNARLNRRVEAQNVEIRSLKSENASLKERLSKYEDPEPRKTPATAVCHRRRKRWGMK